jgi:thiamine-phosphate pyrophosphorylase
MATPSNPPKSANRPIVCYVTDRKPLDAPDPLLALLQRIRSAAKAGADWVQIREKDLSARDLLELARSAVSLVAAASTRVIVNDRLDVAIAAGAAGVHLGHESLAAADVVRWCRTGNAPAEFLVGVSCHGLEEARSAENAGANYIVFGPVFDTPSKRSFGPPQGTERLGEVCRAVRIPVIAIGGLTAENAPVCLRAGAAGIAAIRMFQETASEGELASAIQRIHAHTNAGSRRP